MRNFGLALAAAPWLFLAALGAAEESPDTAVVVTEPPALEEGAAARSIPMAEVTLDKETVRGRLLYETDDQIKVELIGKGAFGTRKDSVRSIRLFTLTPAEYHEEVADFYHRGVWNADDPPAAFLKARQEYVTALGSGPGEVIRDRLAAKLDLLSKDREEWQKEALRREELTRAREQTELVRLQKQAAAEQIVANRRYDQYIKDLQTALKGVDDQMQRMGAFVVALQDRVKELEDDVDDLGRRERVLVTTQVFLELSKSHDDLRRRVDRMSQDRGQN